MTTEPLTIRVPGQCVPRAFPANGSTVVAPRDGGCSTGPTFKAKIVVVGKGEGLAFESAPPLLPLLQDSKVTAQLANSDGFCWQAEYSTNLVNDGVTFKARGD